MARPANQLPPLPSQHRPAPAPRFTTPTVTVAGRTYALSFRRPDLTELPESYEPVLADADAANAAADLAAEHERELWRAAMECAYASGAVRPASELLARFVAIGALS